MSEKPNPTAEVALNELKAVIKSGASNAVFEPGALELLDDRYTATFAKLLNQPDVVWYGAGNWKDKLSEVATQHGVIAKAVATVRRQTSVDRLSMKLAANVIERECSAFSNNQWSDNRGPWCW